MTTTDENREARRAAGDGRARDDGKGRPGVNMVGKADFRSYYGRPILKEPVWTWEIPWYFFVGGMAGGCGPLAFGARLTGNDRLARAALTAGAAGLAVSPVLLISDLGRPARAAMMLRVFKPTSPMNMGSWILAAYSPALLGAALADRAGIVPRLARVAEGVGALLGPLLTTYTAVLVADTAVPVWHEAGRELPLVFAASGSASAGAAATLLLGAGPDSAPARRMAFGAAVTELAATQVMEHRLGDLAEPYRLGRAGKLSRAAKLLTGAGAAVTFLARDRHVPATVGAVMLLAGSACLRQSVTEAGKLSARDPKYVVGPQRERLAKIRSQSNI